MSLRKGVALAVVLALTACEGPSGPTNPDLSDSPDFTIVEPNPDLSTIIPPSTAVVTDAAVPVRIDLPVQGINFAAVQRCPLVVIIENNGYAYSTPTSKQTAAKSFADKGIGYGVPGVRADGNDVLETYRVTREAVDRARAGEGVSIIELMTYRRKGHAEHDNQSYVPAGEIERWAAENDPLDRFIRVLGEQHGVVAEELERIDARVRDEVDRATDLAETSPPPEALDALVGVYADPPAMPALWYREGIRTAVQAHERPASWGTHDG